MVRLLEKKLQAAPHVLADASVDPTNGTSLSVIVYYKTTYNSNLAADIGLIPICAKVHLAKNEGISHV